MLILRSAASGSSNRFCYLEGEPCSKLKRAAEAVAEALAEPYQDSESGEQI